MLTVSIYSTITGRVTANVTATSAVDIALNTGPDEAVIDGHIDPATHYIRDGVAVAYPPRPGRWARWTGSAWIDPRSAEERAAELQAARQAAIARVNAAAGAIRARFVTQIPAQEMLYLRKEAEARAWIADPAPDLADYPLLAAEIGVTAPTAAELAQIWLNLAQIWISVAAPLETARLSGVGALEGAATDEAIDTALSTTLTAIATIAGAIP